MTGTLYIVATPIGNLKDVTQRAVDILTACGLICCEDTRHSGMLLKNLGVVPKSLLPLHKLNEASQIGKVLKTLLSDVDVALISDAGTPLISDPAPNSAARQQGSALFFSEIQKTKTRSP